MTRLILLIAVLIWAPPSWAVVAVDAVTETTSAGFTASPFTFAHTTSGSNRGLIVCVLNDNTLSQTFTATYAGVSMTQVATVAFGASSVPRVTMFRLENPASGTNNVVLTPSGNTWFSTAAVSFTGAHQTNMVGSSASATGTGTPITVNVTGTSDGIALDCAGTNRTGLVPVATVGAGQTQQWNVNNLGAYVNDYGSTETGSGTVTMSWSIDQTVGWATIAANVVAASGGGPDVSRFYLRRVQ